MADECIYVVTETIYTITIFHIKLHCKSNTERINAETYMGGFLQNIYIPIHCSGVGGFIYYI